MEPLLLNLETAVYNLLIFFFSFSIPPLNFCISYLMEWIQNTNKHVTSLSLRLHNLEEKQKNLLWQFMKFQNPTSIIDYNQINGK